MMNWKEKINKKKLKNFNRYIIFNSDNYINNGNTSKNESEKIAEEKNKETLALSNEKDSKK